MMIVVRESVFIHRTRFEFVCIKKQKKNYNLTKQSDYLLTMMKLLVISLLSFKKSFTFIDISYIQSANERVNNLISQDLYSSTIANKCTDPHFH